MKKFLSIILLSLVLFYCVSCNNTNELVESETNSVNTTSTDNTVGENELNTTNKDESIDNGSIQSEIELNMNNYTSYLTYTSEKGYNNGGYAIENFNHTVSGALRYAYYKNVVLTFKVKFYNKSEDSNETMTYEVLLNAAGDAAFTNGTIDKRFDRYYNGTVAVTLESVSGKVIIPNMKV